VIAFGVLTTIIFFAAIVVFFIFLYYFPIGLWLRTVAAGVPLSIGSLIRMRIIGIPPGIIVTNLVRARKAGLPLNVDQMQSHLLAGGNVENVVLAVIAAQRAEIPLEWQRAAAIDLAGRNVLEALQTSVNPKVIETPIFQGVAKDGIQLNVTPRVTVPTNIDRYVRGASEPTISARVRNCRKRISLRNFSAVTLWMRSSKGKRKSTSRPHPASKLIFSSSVVMTLGARPGCKNSCG